MPAGKIAGARKRGHTCRAWSSHVSFVSDEATADVQLSSKASLGGRCAPLVAVSAAACARVEACAPGTPLRSVCPSARLCAGVDQQKCWPQRVSGSLKRSALPTVSLLAWCSTLWFATLCASWCQMRFTCQLAHAARGLELIGHATPSVVV